MPGDHRGKVGTDNRRNRPSCSGGQHQGGLEAAPGREALLHRIGCVIENEQGSVVGGGAIPTTPHRHRPLPRQHGPERSEGRNHRGVDQGRPVRSVVGHTNGLGDTVSIASNADAAGKSQKRRVEIIVPRRC